MRTRILSKKAVGVVADLGGTNARFALVDGAGLVHARRSYRAAEFSSIERALARYLGDAALSSAPANAVLAIAGQVTDGRARFSNLAWNADAATIREAFGFHTVELINDFVAQALAASRLTPRDLRTVGPALVPRSGVKAVIGAGTGFGAAALVSGPATEIAIASEAGHASFAPTDEVELRLWKRLKARYGRVSIERVLSGSGLVSVYAAVCEQIGESPMTTGPAEVVAAARRGSAQAANALDRFAKIYGQIAGDLALTFGASGGVYIAGGVAPKILDWLNRGSFRAAFEDKGRLSWYVRGVPTLVVTHPYPGLLGAAAKLSQMVGEALAPAPNGAGLPQGEHERSSALGRTAESGDSEEQRALAVHSLHADFAGGARLS